MDNKKLIPIIIIVLLLIVGGVGFWYFRGEEAPSPISQLEGAAAGATDGLGAEALNKVNNPLANEFPETNPFQVNTNPFEKQKNAFDLLYNNPFGL